MALIPMKAHFIYWLYLLISIYPSTGHGNAPMLLYSTEIDIRLLDTSRSKLKPTILIKNLTDGAALDYHYVQNKICWTDRGRESIQCTVLNATVREDEIEVISTKVISPDGLACDWITSKLYWTDSGMSHIEVASMMFKYRKVLFWTDVDQPRAIALDPMQGLMFWTDWGEVPKIERAGMNGDPATRQVIVSDDIMWPNGLTLDYENKFIYWIDGKMKFLKKMDYNGDNVSIIIKSGLEYPFALTHFNGTLYWTDWKKWSICFYKNTTKDNKKEPKEFLHSDSVPVDIHIWDPRRQPSFSHPCETKNGGCSHLCLLSPNPPNYTCACPIGIKLIDNHTCADGPQEMLIFARRTEMCIVYLDSPDYTYRVMNLTNMKFSIAVDYDPIEKFIYWTDSTVKKIQRAKLDGSEQSDVLSFEIESSDGIAIDWVARNIYWTDTGYDHIEVATLNGMFRKVIISDGLLAPRAIAVAPYLGWLFWSDWNEKSPKIERSNLDGSNRTVIISDKLGWANGIALDFENLKIYWCDAKNDIIEFSSMDGTDRRVLVDDNIPHPFGFTLMGDFLYWTDWQKRTISRIHKVTGANREEMIDKIPNIMGLKAIKIRKRSELERNTNPCGVNNGGCAHICLYLHNTTFICVCQIGYELLKDGRTCVVPEAFLLYTKRDGIGRVSIENDNNELQLPISGVKHPSSINFDINNMRIYWSDIKQHSIMRAYVNGSDPQKVVEQGLAMPKGLVVDWVALNIYWADPAAHRIEVARLDGSSRRVLLWKNENVEPHSIALDPEEGYMYWTECDVPGNTLNCIKKAAMDGSDARTLVPTTGCATGLTLDYEKRRLYWAETNIPAIVSSDLNGLNKTTLLKEGLSKPLGLTLYKDFIYWTDELAGRKGEVAGINKFNGQNRTKIHSFNEVATDLLIIPSAKPKSLFNQCAVNNGDCSHLCLALPSKLPGESTGYTCACPTHYVLKNNTCIPPKHFMIYSHKNLAVRFLPYTAECPIAVLPIQGLKNVKAIDFDPVLQFLYWIEGKTHSIKRAKAIGTHISVVVAGHQGVNPIDIAVDALGRLLFWSCSIHDVINVTRVDNYSSVGVVVREQGEKPRLLAIHPTKRLLIYTDVGDTHQIVRRKMDGSQKVQIADTGSILVSAIAVDFENDMIVWAQGHSIYMRNIDGENHHIVLNNNNNNSKISQLTVYSGWLYWLDREYLQRLDLKTGGSGSIVSERDSDILDLISVTEPNRNHSCAQMHSQKCSHLCILNGTSALCACPQGLALQSDKKTCGAVRDCGKDFFTCSAHGTENKDCIPKTWRCDSQADCRDGSDEAGCPECGAEQFRCQNGDCIDAIYVCDDIPQCKDKSDEAHCCKHPNEFQCPVTNVCIPVSALCDGTDHCADGEDEKSSVCAESSRYTSTGFLGLLGIVFWIFMLILSLVIVIVAYYYIKRSVYTGNMDNADQSEDPLNPVQNRGQIKPQKMKNKAIPDVVHMSMLNGSQISGYDRDHITGASSSTNGSSIACYPRETLNPPPSPATTAASTRTSSPTARYRPYKHYRSINQPPPPTPCSTDICDESDYNYPTNSNRSRYDDRNRYDIGPFPPPPTPRSHCNSESCPPSPSSRSSTYFSPLPPPPSPVASPQRGYDL